MTVDRETMLTWCRRLLGLDPSYPKLPLPDYLAAIPRLESLSDVPSGTAVLVRGDLDAKPGARLGEGDIRLRSMKDTLEFGRQRGWRQIVLGHIGRKPEESLKKVAARLAEIVGTDVPLIENWLDEASLEVRQDAAAAIGRSPAGSIVMLENTRRYEIERVLWKAGPDDVPQLADRLARLSNTVADRLGRVYVNEALSAGSLDASTTILPAAMDRVALGKYVAAEFDGPMLRCLETRLVIFSGLKIDKLDDLEAMIGRGKIRMVIAAGSLAMALKKAAALLDGKDFPLGLAENADHRDKPYYIAQQRIEQAKRMIAEGRAKGIEFVLPIDFVLQDGTVSETIPPDGQQFDIGPKTSALFAAKVGEFLEKHRGKDAVVFHNGVFGMFEDPRFERGTREFMAQLKRLKEAGAEVYVGGGEGDTALERYGSPSDVSHVFTAGGTVLNALGSEPVPYLIALKMAAERSRKH